MIYLDLFLITLMVVAVIDISGFYEEMSSMIKKWLTKGKFNEPFYVKPFCCSLCMSWWINLIYIIVTGNFSLLLMAYILGLAVMTPVFKEIIVAVRNACLKIVCDIEDWFELT